MRRDSRTRFARSLRGARSGAWAAGVSLALAVGCASSQPPPPVVATVDCESGADEAVYRRAEAENAKLLEAEIRRLRVDLQQAEDALVLAESGIRGTYSRVDAVSALAETRIELERVAAKAPWRVAEIGEAREKLDEAAAQIDQEHVGAALFFTYRARRLADKIALEARTVETTPGARYVKVERVNLRAGPSTTDEVIQVLHGGVPVFPERSRDGWVLVRASTGSVGWVHHSLLSD